MAINHIIIISDILTGFLMLVLSIGFVIYLNFIEMNLLFPINIINQARKIKIIKNNK